MKQNKPGIRAGLALYFEKRICIPCYILRNEFGLKYSSSRIGVIFIKHLAFLFQMCYDKYIDAVPGIERI